MAIFTTNFAELLLPGLRKVYGDTYKDWPEEYSKVFKLETSKKSKEDDLSMSGLGLVPQKPEGQGITYDTAFQGLKKTYTHLAFGMGVAITREMFEDDLYRKMKSMASGLARSVRHTIEIEGANVLNRAFDGTNYADGSDGLELCSDAHTTIGGGNYRNELATSADLDITSFEAALVDIETQFIDERGLKLRVMPQKMVIHPSNIWQAKKILKSGQEPDTANNAINPGMGILPGGFIVMHELSDADAWFITTDVPNGLTWFWRRKPEFTKDNDFDTENAKFKTTMRFSHGWTDPRGIYGSPGA